MASPIPLVDPVTSAVFPFSMQASLWMRISMPPAADYNASPVTNVNQQVPWNLASARSNVLARWVSIA
jgi:hypothetical protein